MNAQAEPNETEIQAYVDGRLPPARRVALEAALARDPALAAEVAGMVADRAALRAALAPVAAAPVPPHLRAMTLTPARSAAPLGRIAAAVALFALGLGAGWIGRPALMPHLAPPATAGFAQSAELAYAVYSVEVTHPVEIGAEAQDHLLAWLSKRIGRPIAAPDLSAQGFSLMGGRLLPSAGQTGAAAQLMYQDRAGQRLTLYVAAIGGDETAFRFTETPEGIASLTWVDQGFGFAVSARMGREALWPLAETAYHALTL